MSGTLFTTKAHAFNDKGSYSITITAKDPSDGSDSITVTLTPSGSDDTPVVKGPDFIRYTENGTWALATYSASISGRAVNQDIGWIIGVEPGGGDGDFFDIDDDGNLTFTQPPDYENPADEDEDNRYSFHLHAYDTNPPNRGRSGQTFFTVTVIVEDSTVEPLEIEGPTSVRYPENSTDAVAAYTLKGTTASHTWHLSGRDAGEFSLSSSGVLTFKNPPDYENPADTAGENAYLLTISADTADDSKTEFVRVTVTDVNEPPEFDEGGTATRKVEHDAELNDPVGGPVTATDPDQDASLTYSLSDAATLPFAISEYTGQLSVSGALDTNRSSYTVTVLVADGKDDNGDYDIDDVDDRITVTINIEGPINSEPEFPSTETGARSFPENTTGVHNVGIPVSATDADTGDTLTYSLGGTDAGSFTIVSSSGQIQTKTGQTYDYEVKSSYSVTVSVRDSKDADGNADTAVDATQNVTISLTNLDEAGTVTLSPSQPSARAQITATLADPDGSISGTTWQWQRSNDGNTWHDVGTDSGSYIPVDGDIGYSLRATATYTDGHGSNKTAQATTTQAVGAGSNRAPEFGGATTTREFAEDAPVGHSVGAPVTATDDDNHTLTYTLEGTDAGSFEIVSTSGQIQTKTGVTYDYETDPSYSVTVKADDKNGGTDTIDVTITVTDANDAPTFAAGTLTFSVPENSPADTDIGSPVTATDTDTGARLTYTLEGTDKDSFKIVTGTGQIQTKAGVTYNYEAKSSYSVTVKADDSNGGTATKPVTINLTNVNEPPAFGSNTATRSIAENTAANTNIGPPVAATDPDAGATLTYTLGGTDASDFGIDTSTGQLKTKSALDKETKSSYEVTVSVKDGKADDGTADANEDADATITVTITVTDANDPPTFSTESETRSFPENTEAGQDIGDVVTADDPDDDTLTYSLEGTDKDSFDIDSSSGQIKTKAGQTYDYEAKSSYSVTVKADDSNGGTATKPVTITLTNVDEPGTVTLSTNQPPARAQITATLTDPDGSATGKAWQWAKSNDGATWTNIGTDSDSYSPSDAEMGYSLRATVTYTDPQGPGKTAQATTTQAVRSGTNRAPDFGATNADRQVAENTGGGVNIGSPVTASDADSDTLTYTLEGTDKDSFQIVSTSGQIQTKSGVTYDYEGTKTSYSVTVKADDKKGGTGTIDVTITVTDANDKPAFDAETATREVSENTATNTDFGAPVEATDQDNGDTLTYSLDTAGALVFDIDTSTGQLKTKAALDKETKDTYTVTVSVRDSKDSSGNADTATDDTITVTITVADVNEPPEFDDGDQTARRVSEAATAGQDIGAPVAATDPDAGATLTYTLGGTDASDFGIDTSTGQLKTKSALDKETKSSYEVTVSVKDGKNDQGVADTSEAADDTVTVTITVTDVNEAPEFDSNTATRSIAENTEAGQPIGNPVAATDPDAGATLTYTLGGTDASSFAIVATSGQLQTKAALDKETKDTYTVTVSVRDSKDSSGNADTATDDTITVTITVADVNEPPEFDDGDPTTRRVSEAAAAGQDIGAPVAATDPDAGATLTYTLGGTDAASFDIVATSGQLQTKAVLDKETEDTYTVTVSVRDSKDSSGVADTATDDTITVTITVTDANDAPVVSGDTTVNHPENDSGTVATYNATDQDGTPTTFTWTLSGDDAGDFSITGGALTFDPAPNYEAAADKDTNNVYLVKVEASDGTAKGTRDVTVTVTDVDEDGEITFSSIQPQAGTGLVATLTDDDIVQSIQNWQWEISGSNTWTTITGATATGDTTTYEPLDDDVGKYLRVTATYTDGHGSGKTATATTTNMVEEEPTSNEGPEFSTDTAQRSIAENTAAGQNIGQPVTATDSDTDTLTYFLEGTDAASFDIVPATGQLQTKDALDYEVKNSYTVTVKAADPSLDSDTITVTIAVTDVNEPPEFDDGDQTARRVSEAAAAGQNIGAPVGATDPERDTLTYSLGGTDAASFDIVATSGQLQTRAALDEETEDTYTVTVSVRDSKDSSGNADTATDDTITVTITVTDANDAPVVSGDTTVNHPENDGGTVATYSATDQDGTTSFTWTLSGDDAGDFSITGGTLTFDPAPNYEAATDKDTNNVYLVTVEASDGTAKGTLNVTVTVTDVNEPPEFDDGDQAARRVSEAAAAGQNIGAPVVATDPESDTLTYSLGGTDAASFAIVATSGQLQTRAALDEETKDTYTVTVSVMDSKDSSGNADTATDDTITVTITVAGANGPPVISGGPRSDTDTPITYPENSRETVAKHSYHDPENDSVTWLLSGTDSGDFSISSAGDLTFRSAPDYESPADSNKNNEYRVTVNANDGNGGSDSTHVAVKVTNVEETGTVTLSPTQALVGTQLTATLADPDGSLTSFTWSWEISSDKSSWNSISGATSASYTPVAGDLGKHLRAKVSYTDGHGSGKTAYSAPTGAVRMSNRPPAFPGSGGGEPKTRTVEENTPAGRNIGTPVAATDPDTSAGDSLTYTLGGTDAGFFAIVATSGQLQTRAALDYETRNSYGVTVTVTDLSNASDSITITIQVADVDEAGTVTLSSTWPRAGAALTASLSDPDAPVTAMSWQWARSNSRDGSYNNISGATSAAYTPVAGDVGKHLRAAVAYTDRHGSGKRAQTVSDNPVIQARVNAAPNFGPGPAARSIPENTPAGRSIGAPVTASDPDPGDSLTYTLGGTDAVSFAIVATSGQLQTRAALDYETRNSYTVTVTATDQFDARDTIIVNITVTNVEPPGKPGTPAVAAASVGGHNTLSVTWAAPAKTAIGGYNVQYRAGTGGSWTSIPGSVSGTAATVSGLVPGAAYQVQVRAYNSEGTGPWSDPGQGSTAVRQQRNILRSAAGGGVMSPACTPSIGFRTGIPWSFTAAKGGEDPPGLLLEVWDRELCGMNFRVSSGAKWLSISPASGRSEGAHDQTLIRVSADISGLDAGTHTAAIRITAPKGGNSPQTVSVSLTITKRAPPESNYCQERTVIESSDSAFRVVVPANSAPCDTGITVESLDADSQQAPAGENAGIVRAGQVSAASADTRINAALWALLPGDRVSACEEAAEAAVYRVDGDSWDLLTHRCEMDEQGRVWMVLPLTGFGVYVVTLPAPSVESGAVGEAQLQTPEAAESDTSPATPSPETMASNGPASSINAVESQPTPAPKPEVVQVEVQPTPAPGPDVVHADESPAGLWADLPPEELALPVVETGQSPPRRLGSLGILLYILAPIILIIALLLIMFGVRNLRGAESASP